MGRWVAVLLLLLGWWLALVSTVAWADPPQLNRMVLGNQNVWAFDPNVSAFATVFGQDPGNVAHVTINGADELENVLMLKGYGSNGNGTLLFTRTLGTEKNPQPVNVPGSILGFIGAQGQHVAVPGSYTYDGLSPGVSAIEFNTCSDWATDSCTQTTFFSTWAGMIFPQFDGRIRFGRAQMQIGFSAAGHDGVNIACGVFVQPGYQVVGGIVVGC